MVEFKMKDGANFVCYRSNSLSASLVVPEVSCHFLLAEVANILRMCVYMDRVIL
jgi:hypothetical protein